MDVLAWKLRATSATQLGRSSNIPRELVVRRLKRLKDMQLVELSQTAVHDWQLSGRVAIGKTVGLIAMQARDGGLDQFERRSHVWRIWWATASEITAAA